MFVSYAYLCVQKVSDKYIMKRWSKSVKESQSNKLIVEDGAKDTTVCSFWRMQMGRKMNALLTASQMNREARLFCEEYFRKLKELVIAELWSVYVEDNVQQDCLSSATSVLNPPRSQEKATNLERKKAIEVILENITGSQELSKPTNLEGQRSRKVASQNANAILVQSYAPLCMNVPYTGPSSQGNVVPILNLLSNSNPNDRNLCQVS
ncbi:hypothetical protein Cgig2_003055 [Carnegiea gigantea]|uniref:Tyrosine-protein phosphatase domain-containing protein n=1 Tax=Carnegiea gigantea TaxID=171969 RepID=A0A9Q1JT35_9CARY|nr:hypothetical protein Cgig2_003055 [Carnegiea gigantea]